MSFLLVAVLLFSISSSSVSSHQYYVSDNCSSVTHSPCHSLSVYLEDEYIQYNNSVFYFIGTNYLNGAMNVFLPYNVTWQGVDESSAIQCLYDSISISLIVNHFNISNLSLHKCGLRFSESYDVSISHLSLFQGFIAILVTSNVSISNSAFSQMDYLVAIGGFDIKILSTFITGGNGNNLLGFQYYPPNRCNYELKNYSLELINVSIHNMVLGVFLHHSLSYNVLVRFNDVTVNYGISFTISSKSLHQIQISNTSCFGALIGFEIIFDEFHPDARCDLANVQKQSYIVINNCQFYESRHGFFIFAFSSKLKATSFLIEECLIYNNVVGVGIFESENVTILNTKVNNNERNLLIYSKVFLRNVSISNTLSSGLTLKRSTVVVGDSLFIFNNTGTNGGGLAMYDESNIKLLPESQVNIVSNHATKKGGGIYTNNLITCPLHSDSNLSMVYVNVSNNFADLVGHDIYGYVDKCSNYFNEGIKSAGTPYVMCFCDPNNASIIYNMDNCPGSINIIDKQAFLGQKLKFDIIMIGNSYSGNSVTAGEFNIHLNNSILVERQSHPANCSSVEIILQTSYGPHTIKFLLYRDVDSFSILVDMQNSWPLLDVSLDFDVFINECPIGFSVNDSSECDCSQSVYRQNVTCDINTQTITHNSLLWIGTYDTSTSFSANATNPNACIVNEDCLLYCSPNPVTFQLNDTDTQCVDNRGQRMCGSCRDGFSLLMGSNKCGRCDDTNNYIIITWLLLFAVMGVSLVFLLIALNLTVSVGTLNGLLFYANIVKLYEPVFSREGALPVLNQVISWINLEFGFEACLYNGMDSYAKQWLQFAFPLYLWVIIIIIIQLCRRYGKISRLMGSHAVPVLSTLFLLSYTKLVRTIVIVVHKREVTLYCSNESVRSVSLWYEDPNVEYAKGKHAVLLGFALLVGVLFVIPYTLFLLVNPFYEKYLSNYKLLKKFWNRFKPIIDAYSGPMRDEYRFWPGLLLVARIPVLLSVTLVDSFIQSQHFLLSMLLTVLAIVLSLGYCFCGVYLKKLNNLIETWFLCNLCIMIALSVTLNDDHKVLIWYNACLSVFIFSFILIVVYHVYLQLSCTRWYDALIKKLFKKQDEDDDSLLDVTESHKTVDQQRREFVPSSTSVRFSVSSRESVVDLY